MPSKFTHSPQHRRNAARRRLVRSCTLAAALVAVLSLASCAEQCNMAGKTTIPGLDGQTLRLSAFFDDGTKRPEDTCRIVHGNFSFYCDADSMYVASINVGHETLLPIVVENGKLQIIVDNVGTNVKGGPMNDKLYKFRRKQERLYSRLNELQDKCVEMMRQGASYDDAIRKYGEKMRDVEQDCSRLETTFIIENSDNVLGTSFFRMKYGGTPLPVVTDEINDILTAAKPAFLEDPYVRYYLGIAVHNPMSKPCKLPLR